MGEIVNLRRARKAAARAAARETAAENRVRHGRPHAVRETEAQAAARQRRSLDGHRLEGRDGDASAAPASSGSSAGPSAGPSARPFARTGAQRATDRGD